MIDVPQGPMGNTAASDVNGIVSRAVLVIRHYGSPFTQEISLNFPQAMSSNQV